MCFLFSFSLTNLASGEQASDGWLENARVKLLISVGTHKCSNQRACTGSGDDCRQ
jgi:hypothetical protein